MDVAVNWDMIGEVVGMTARYDRSCVSAGKVATTFRRRNRSLRVGFFMGLEEELTLP